MRRKIIIGETYGMLTVDAATEEKDSADALLWPCLRYTVTRRQDPPQNHTSDMWWRLFE